MKIAIIGAGVSGLFSSVILKDQDVTVFEKNDKPGLKLNITGKGRCNLTNDCTQEEFLENVTTNPRFLYSAINAFSPQNTIRFFNDLGLETITERGRRVFPKYKKAKDVTDLLHNEAKKNNVKFVYESVLDLDRNGESFMVKTNKDTYVFDVVFVCTGGVSYPETGSTGDGYSIAKKFSHTVVSPKPALVPIQTQENVLLIKGLNLKNVQITVVVGKKKFSQFGEVEFWTKGVCGPTVLTLSSYLNKFDLNGAQIVLDLKPALSEEKLDKRIIREIEDNSSLNLEELLRKLLPSPLVSYFTQRLQFDGKIKVRNLSKEQRLIIVHFLKNLTFSIDKLDKVERAIVTSGGVSVKEINPKTMESKLQNGLYFVGEVLDVDALTGGYNMQIAFCTAYCACIDVLNKS